MVFFYPERLDIFREAEELAKSLGGELQIPRFSWKYSWIEPIFGRAQGEARSSNAAAESNGRWCGPGIKRYFAFENRNVADSLGR